jgi:hypothetical protein
MCFPFPFEKRSKTILRSHISFQSEESRVRLKSEGFKRKQDSMCSLVNMKYIPVFGVCRLCVYIPGLPTLPSMGYLALGGSGWSWLCAQYMSEDGCVQN